MAPNSLGRYRAIGLKIRAILEAARKRAGYGIVFRSANRCSFSVVLRLRFDSAQSR